MKKFLAGALAALSVLSVSAPAYAAATKNITETGGIFEYEVAVTNPKIVLKVVLPAELDAALNPYSCDFQIDDMNTIHSQTGIVSVAYPVYNLDTNYGVFIGATAVTTTAGSWSVTTGALTPGVRGANMSLTASDTAEGITQYSNVKKTATSLTDQGNLPLDSTVPADSTKRTAKGQTSLSKLAYIPASDDGVTEQKIYLGFTGKLAEDSDTVILDWTENDYINVNLVLKLTPGPKTL